MEIHRAVMPGLCQPEFITLRALFFLWDGVIFPNFLWWSETSLGPL